MRPPRALACALLLAASACTSGGNTIPIACPQVFAALPVTMVAPAPGAANVADTLAGLTVQGSFGAVTQIVVSLTPAGGGPVLTQIDNLIPIPQPGPAQYALGIPHLAPATTYAATLALPQTPGPCPALGGATLGSFTTQ